MLSPCLFLTLVFPSILKYFNSTFRSPADALLRLFSGLANTWQHFDAAFAQEPNERS